MQTCICQLLSISSAICQFKINCQCRVNLNQKKERSVTSTEQRIGLRCHMLVVQQVLKMCMTLQRLGYMPTATPFLNNIICCVAPRHCTKVADGTLPNLKPIAHHRPRCGPLPHVNYCQGPQLTTTWLEKTATAQTASKAPIQ